MTKKATTPTRVQWPKHGIKTAGMAKTSSGATDGFRYVIDPAEQQVIDNRGGAAPHASAQAHEAYRGTNLVAEMTGCAYQHEGEPK
jgi:hypothetical protein